MQRTQPLEAAVLDGVEQFIPARIGAGGTPQGLEPQGIVCARKQLGLSRRQRLCHVGPLLLDVRVDWIGARLLVLLVFGGRALLDAVWFWLGPLLRLHSEECRD